MATKKRITAKSASFKSMESEFKKTTQLAMKSFSSALRLIGQGQTMAAEKAGVIGDKASRRARQLLRNLKKSKP